MADNSSPDRQTITVDKLPPFGPATETEPPRIRFGPAPGNSIPAEWAQPLLTRLHAAHPALFGKQLMELYAEVRLGQSLTVAKRRERAR